jgi:hypothetical protein
MTGPEGFRLATDPLADPVVAAAAVSVPAAVRRGEGAIGPALDWRPARAPGGQEPRGARASWRLWATSRPVESQIR